jgi:hypothetical protein
MNVDQKFWSKHTVDGAAAIDDPEAILLCKCFTLSEGLCANIS